MLLALIWGYTWPVMKVMLTYAEPFPYAAMRTFTAGLHPGRTVCRCSAGRCGPRPSRMTALLGVLQTAGFLGLMTWALQGEGAGKTAILTYTMPFWLLLMAWVFSGGEAQRVPVGRGRPGSWRTDPGARPLGDDGRVEPLPGDRRRALLGGQRHRGQAAAQAARGGPALADRLAAASLGRIPLVVVAAATWSPPVWSGTFIAGFIFTVLAGNCLAWILWLYILSALPAGTAGLGMLLTPVIGIIASWIQLGERPGGIEGLGMLLIVGALLLTVAAEVLRGRRQRSLSGR